MKSKLIKAVHLRSDLFATTICFAGMALVKLGSSVILTRILYPEAYGVIAALSSIVFAIEMFSDLGILALMIRHEKGDDPTYINTMWTVRLIRGCTNCVILFTIAPWVASLYDAPMLVYALRVFSIWFVLHGLESISFTLAVRHKKVYIVSYTDLVCSVTTSVFVIFFSMYAHDYRGILYGMVLNRLMMTVASYFFFKPQRAAFQFDKQARKDLFQFSKHIVPSSMIAFFLSQFDRIIFLKLFDLHLFGLYGLASNVSQPVISLIEKISRFVLYPRCAHDFRADRETSHIKYYKNNLKIFAIILALPAIIGGASDLIVQILFDSRYAYAGTILQAFMIRAILISLASPAEDLLVAAGKTHVVLVGNILRISWVVPGCLIGFYFFAFPGFLYAAALETLPALVYLIARQKMSKMLIFKFELLKIAFAVCVFVLSLGISRTIDVSMLHQDIKSMFQKTK